MQACMCVLFTLLDRLPHIYERSCDVLQPLHGRHSPRGMGLSAVCELTALCAVCRCGSCALLWRKLTAWLLAGCCLYHKRG